LLTKRVVPCLDVMRGVVVKGVRFADLKPVGDPRDLAAQYEQEGADEIALLDISASVEARPTDTETVRRVAEVLSVPLLVGGGVRSVDDVKRLLEAGADRVSVNTAAVKDPQLVRAASRLFGSQCVVVAIDAKKKEGSEGWEVYIHGGKKPTGLDAIEWAKTVCELGAGELLVTSIDADGTRAGYDVELLRELSRNVNVPIIASGGAGSPFDMYLALTEGRADAVLAASIFHYRSYTVRSVKEELAKMGVPVRL